MFPLLFGLTEGRAKEAGPVDKGRACLGGVIVGVAASMRRAADESEVQARACMLRTCVPGHPFPTVDGRAEDVAAPLDGGTFLPALGMAVLGRPQSSPAGGSIAPRAP